RSQGSANATYHGERSLPARSCRAGTARSTYVRAARNRPRHPRSTDQPELSSTSDRSRRSAHSGAASRDSARGVRPVVRLCFQRLRYVREDVRQWKDLRVWFRIASSWVRRRSSSACRSGYKNPGPADSLQDIFDSSERCRGAFCNLHLVFVKAATAFSAQPAGVDIALQQRTRPVFGVSEPLV